MNKKLISAIALILTAGCSNVRTIGQVNGVTLTRVTTRGVFSPASTVILGSNSDKPGEVDVLSTASGPGVLPAVATAGGIAGGAALLRPARSDNSVQGGSVQATGNTGNNTANGGGGGAAAGGNATATGTGGIGGAAGHSHPNSPGNGGEPGNGGQNHGNPHN